MRRAHRWRRRGLRCDWFSLTPFGYPSIERRGPAHPLKIGMNTSVAKAHSDGTPGGARQPRRQSRRVLQYRRFEKTVAGIVLNSSSKTRPGIVSVTSRTWSPDRRSNDDDCQLSTCAGLNTFTRVGAAVGGVSTAGSREGEAAARTVTWRPDAVPGFAGTTGGSGLARFSEPEACASLSGLSSRYSPNGESEVIRQTRRETVLFIAAIMALSK